MNRYRRLTTCCLLVLGAAANAVEVDLSEADCMIEPNEAVELSTAVDGVIAAINVERGDRVTKGQILVQLQSGVEAASVSVAKARLGDDSLVELAQERLAFALRKQSRTDELYSEKAISEFSKDEVDLEVNMASLELRRAREDMIRASYELERAEQVLALRTIRSPLDGVVVERNCSPGEAIGEQQTVLMKLVQLDPLNVELTVPASEFGRLRIGDVLSVETIGPVEGEFQAEVAVIDPIIDASSETFGVRALLPNPDNEIPAGLSCRVSSHAGHDALANIDN